MSVQCSGDENSYFQIQKETGQISVAGVVNFEAKPLFTLVVRVTDDGTPPLSDTATVTITVADVNEAPTINSNQVATTDENTPRGAQVMQLQSSDVDVKNVQWSTVQWSLVSGGDTALAVSTTGVVSVLNDVLDFETKDVQHRSESH
jgi:hypothetical protein